MREYEWINGWMDGWNVNGWLMFTDSAVRCSYNLFSRILEFNFFFNAKKGFKIFDDWWSRIGDGF